MIVSRGQRASGRGLDRCFDPSRPRCHPGAFLWVDRDFVGLESDCDVMIVDPMLPGLDGLGIVKTLRGGQDASEVLQTLAMTYIAVAEDLGKRLAAKIVPGIHVVEDRELLTQLFVNLIENGLRLLQREPRWRSRSSLASTAQTTGEASKSRNEKRSSIASIGWRVAAIHREAASAWLSLRRSPSCITRSSASLTTTQDCR